MCLSSFFLTLEIIARYDACLNLNVVDTTLHCICNREVGNVGFIEGILYAYITNSLLALLEPVVLPHDRIRATRLRLDNVLNENGEIVSANQHQEVVSV